LDELPLPNYLEGVRDTSKDIYLPQDQDTVASTALRFLRGGLSVAATTLSLTRSVAVSALS